MTETNSQISLESVVEELLRLRTQDHQAAMRREEKRLNENLALIRRIEALEKPWWVRIFSGKPPPAVYRGHVPPRPFSPPPGRATSSVNISKIDVNVESFGLPYSLKTCTTYK